MDQTVVWPPSLRKTSPPPLLVYLDQNRWIELAKAARGHPDGLRHSRALALCLEAKASGAVRFPLSASHYGELNKIRDSRKRFDVADVMESLSEFDSLLSRAVVLELEIDAVLTHWLRPSEAPLPPLPMVGKGVGWAFGISNELRIHNASGDDVTAQTRAGFRLGEAEFDSRVAAAKLRLERSVLYGPSPEEEPELRRLGWSPERAVEIAERRAAQEREQAARLDAEPRWRRGRLRDLVSAREVIIELRNPLSRCMADRHADHGELMNSRDSAMAFVEAMPSTSVAVTLKTAAHRNRDKGWSNNDIYDVDALAIAVPYCHVVVTERHAAHVLRTAGANRQFGTDVLHSLEELTLLLERPTAAS